MSNNKYVKISSEKNFGITFSIIFLLIFLYILIFSNKASVLFLIVSFVLLLISFFYSKLLYWPNLLWFKFGMLIGMIISPIMLSLIYFFIVVPTGLIVRIFKRDLINIKINKNEKTYWKSRKYKPNPLDKQF